MVLVPMPGFRDDVGRSCEVTAGVFIHDDTDPRASIVHVFGEATFADTAALESIVVSAIRIGRPVVIDFLECSYMDCATIGVIVRAAKNLGEQLRLVISSHSQGFRMLHLTGLTRVLNLFASINEAVAPLETAKPPVRLRSV